MKRILQLSLILSLGLTAKAFDLKAQTAKEIVQMSIDRPNGDTRQSEMTMTLINKRGRKRERKMLSYSIDCGKNKQDSKSMMFFLYPGDVKGTGFLTWDYDEIGKDDDKWLYLPAMKKTRRISGSSAKKDYFMGSDFTYDDMGKRNVDEDSHKLLAKENSKDDKPCWKIESISKDKRDVYAKKISWIRKDCLIPIRVEYYDKRGKLQRVLTMSHIKKIDGFWLAQRMKMDNIQRKHQTILEIKDPKFNIKLSEGKFNTNNLEGGHL